MQVINNAYDVSCSGYSPPEYIERGMISVKFDIFSLGVIIIKIMAGRMGYFKIVDMSSEQFIELVRKIVVFIETKCTSVYDMLVF
jgi:serine/threonine protein kinase